MEKVIIQHDAKCKNCKHLKVQHNGKRKEYFCVVQSVHKTLKSKGCNEFNFKYL